MHNKTLPVAALVFNALVWGVSWWPFRQLELRGIHPLWATVCVYFLACGVIMAARPQAFREVLGTPVLWLLAFAAGATNAAFNWGVVVGDVVRVVLLFYLMPVWSALLAWMVLGERMTTLTLLRLLLAMTGAVIVLWPASQANEVALQFGLPEALGLFGGFTFALNNVMLRREGWRREDTKAVAVFSGGVLIPGALALLLALSGEVAWPLAIVPGPDWLLFVLAIASAFLLGNLALQYGAARLPAHVTAVVMLMEVLFAAVTALLLGAGEMTGSVMAGGAMILTAALLSTLEVKPALVGNAAYETSQGRA